MIPIFILSNTLTYLDKQIVLIGEKIIICAPGKRDVVFLTIDGWFRCFTYFFIHSFLILISGSILAFKLINLVSKNKSILEGASKISLSKKEIRGGMTVLTLGILQFSVYIVSFVCCLKYSFYTLDKNYIINHPDLFYESVSAYDMVHVTFIIAHCWSFYVYLIRIPSFRKAFLNLCGFRSVDGGSNMCSNSSLEMTSGRYYLRTHNAARPTGRAICKPI